MSSRSENLVIIIGNLTREPNLRFTANGTAVADLGIATNRTWTGQDGEKKESVEFHQVVAWNKLAEIFEQILSKGDKVYIRGSLRTRNWEDDNGVKHYRTEIKAEDMKLLFSNSSKGFDSSGAGDAGSSDDSGSSSNSTDDIDDFDLDDIDLDGSDKKEVKKEDKKTEKKGSIEDVDLEADDLPF